MATLRHDGVSGVRGWPYRYSKLGRHVYCVIGLQLRRTPAHRSGGYAIRSALSPWNADTRRSSAVRVRTATPGASSSPGRTQSRSRRGDVGDHPLTPPDRGSRGSMTSDSLGAEGCQPSLARRTESRVGDEDDVPRPGRFDVGEQASKARMRLSLSARRSREPTRRPGSRSAPWDRPREHAGP